MRNVTVGQLMVVFLAALFAFIAGAASTWLMVPVAFPMGLIIFGWMLTDTETRSC